MHDQLFIKTLVSLATKKSFDDIFIYWPFGPLEPVIQDMQRVPGGIFFIIGDDRPGEEIYVALDHYLQTQDRSYDVFLLNLDFLDPCEHTRQLARITCLNIDHFTLSSLSWLRQYQHVIERDLVTTHSENLWLSLARRDNPWRRYAKQNWIDRWSDCFIYSFGPNCFHGEFNFYGKIPNASGWVDNTVNFFSLGHLYNSACGSIVNETDGITSYTEKIFHAILALHPVLIIGHPGLVSYLRDRGFDMFDDILDHAYDHIQDPTQRIDALFQDNEQVIKQGLNRDHLRQRLLHNRQHVWQYYQDRMNQFENLLITNLKGLQS